VPTVRAASLRSAARPAAHRQVVGRMRRRGSEVARGRIAKTWRVDPESGDGQIGHGHGHAHGFGGALLSGWTSKPGQHLNHPNREHADVSAPRRRGESASADDIDDRGGLRRASSCDLVKPSLIGAGSSAGAFCDVEHDAQARALQLIPERAVVPARQQAACLGMQPEGEMIDLETFVLELRPAVVGTEILGL